MANLVTLELKGIVLDPVNRMPVILLKQSDSNLLLPIWIGIYEANAIALKLDNIDTPRPMTHDLMINLIQTMEASISHILITKLEDNTFFAEIHLIAGDKHITVDARPSDAIALAVRAEVPIKAHRDVLKHAQSINLDHEDQNEQIKQWLKSLDPEDFGKYNM